MNFIKPEWPAPATIKAYTTLRHGWDDLNEKTLSEQLQLPENPIWLTQKHTAIAVPATPENMRSNADATFTSTLNRVCIVLTADCLPILICNKQGTTVAAIHAGWRGLANGIIEAALDQLNQPPEELLVWLGPAIGPTKFEVGDDVYTAFVTVNKASEAAFIPHHKGKWLANLYHLAKIRLYARNINQVYGGQFCTYTQEELFFSYRRDKGLFGRMASVIWISG